MCVCAYDARHSFSQRHKMGSLLYVPVLSGVLFAEYLHTLGVIGFFSLHFGFGLCMHLEQFVWV